MQAPNSAFVRFFADDAKKPAGGKGKVAKKRPDKRKDKKGDLYKFKKLDPKIAQTPRDQVPDWFIKMAEDFSIFNEVRKRTTTESN
jgi:hypothetical protein